MRINIVTPYSRLLSIVFVFGIFPLIIFYIGKKYQETVTVLTSSHATAYNLRSNDKVIQKTPHDAGKNFATIEHDLEGNWQSDQNILFVFQVKDNNLFYDLYDGKPVASGAWSIRDSLEDTRFASFGSGLYLEKKILDETGQQDVLYYKIVSIDKDSLILKYLEKGNQLKFTKRSSTATTSAESNGI